MATQALAVNGANVYIVGRTEEKLETVTKTYSQGIEGQIIPITADISKKDSIAKLYDEIAQKEDHLDILINNVSQVFVSQQLVMRRRLQRMARTIVSSPLLCRCEEPMEPCLY